MKKLVYAALMLLFGSVLAQAEEGFIPLSELPGGDVQLDLTAPPPWEAMFDFDNSGVNVPRSHNFGCQRAREYVEDGFDRSTVDWVLVELPRTCDSIDDCRDAIEREPIEFITEDGYRPAIGQEFSGYQRVFVNYRDNILVVETLIDQPGSPQWGGCHRANYDLRKEIVNRIHLLGGENI
jgi:hypothetical protein